MSLDFAFVFTTMGRYSVSEPDLDWHLLFNTIIVINELWQAFPNSIDMKAKVQNLKNCVLMHMEIIVLHKKLNFFTLNAPLL